MGQAGAQGTGRLGRTRGHADELLLQRGLHALRRLMGRAFPAGREDNYDAVAPYIRQWAAQVDGIVNASAAETGGVRHVRYVTDIACQLDVAKVALFGTSAGVVPAEDAGERVGQRRSCVAHACRKLFDDERGLRSEHRRMDHQPGVTRTDSEHTSGRVG